MEIGSLWNFGAVPVTYKCDLCLEHKTQTPIQLNAAHAVCKDSFVSNLKPKFEAARTKGFLLSYAEKEKEYKTPKSDRVYCTASSCSKFLGKANADGESIITCSCGSKTCTQYKAVVEETETHTCPSSTNAVDALEGLRLGHDYQRCPQCQNRVELIKGCNHVKCRCGREFYLVCGLPALYGSSHWRPGGCPRYNFPGFKSNAQYDTTPQAHVDTVYHHVEQLQPDRGRPSALLVQAMDALAIDRPALQTPRQQQQEEQRRRTEAQNDARRRAANDIAARMVFMRAPRRGGRR